MNTYTKQVTVFLLIVSLVCSMLPGMRVHAAAQSDEMTIMTDHYVTNGDTFILTCLSRLFVVSDQEPNEVLLQTVQLLQRQFAADERPSDAPMELVWGPEECAVAGDIVVVLDTDSQIGAEGYQIEVTNIVKITAADVDGLLYGGNMLLKQLRIANSNTLNGFTCADTPDTKQRAVSLDCGRKYYSKNWICNFIRELSWMGYNTLELHFSDDSGFRLDLWDEAYYTDTFRPANDFSWICGSNYTSWTLSEYKNDLDKGKYLTTAEVVEILDTAKEYHIDVIPAFDSPSHLDYINWTYEQNYKNNPAYSFYSTYHNKIYCADDVGGIINYTNSSGWSTPLKWPYYSTVDVVSDHAKAFIFELYLNIADFFKTYADSEDFSIGADEVNLSTYNLASGYSFTWGFSDFVDYINELNMLLNQKGYTMRMYNDFMGSTTYNARNYDFADNIEILYWDSPFEPTTGGAGTKTEPVSYYSNQGSILYNCIQTSTYYALRITSGGSDARSIHNRQWTFYHANEEDIYNEWYPANFSEHGDYSEDIEDIPDANLGGAYFLIWCDYACVSTEAQIWNGCYDATSQNTGEFYSLRDRMWSNITKMWNWDVNDTVSFNDFVMLRDGYGDFPGCGESTNACSEMTVLPVATEISAVYPNDCVFYPSYGQLRTLRDAKIMIRPSCEYDEEESAVVDIASAQEVYAAIGLFENATGELWYRVKIQTGKSGYLIARDTEFVRVLTDDIYITESIVPSGYVQGQEFAISGEVRSRFNGVSSTTVSVFDGIGMGNDVVLTNKTVSTDNRCILDNCHIEFEQLSEGVYTYSVEAEYQSYYVLDGQIAVNNAVICLLEKCFVVLNASVDQSTCDHVYETSVLHAATCELEGEQVYICASCGHVYEDTVKPTGHDYAETLIPGTCLDYEKKRYTCENCGHIYETYSDDIYSQWQETKPNGIDESLVQSKTFYRFSDYEMLDSADAVLDGYTLLNSTWEEENSATVSYVDSWPGGFDISSELYSEYHKASEKVTAFETDVKKRVINSDEITGYLYYHWCYSNSYYSISAKSGSYSIFHAYFSTTAPENYVCDYSDMSYRTSHSCCSNSQWFFVTAVNSQKYTDYYKLYHYERWTDWLDWSDIFATETPTRKVESKERYRYVTGSLGAHQWSDGICSVCTTVCEHNMTNGFCTVCGEACSHRFQNNCCTICGFEKPILELYLFGRINGNDYDFAENIQVPEEFRFVNGQLTLFVTQDSNVAVMSPDARYCYMAGSFEEHACSAILYNQVSLEQGYMLTIPGNKLVTFTLTDRGDDTYILSYNAQSCPHESHSQEGSCLVCVQSVEHIYHNGLCSCGRFCVHSWDAGVCTVCAYNCNHEMHDIQGICTNCGDTVLHQYEMETTEPDCIHSGYTTYKCICGYSYVDDATEATGHSYVNGSCSVCGHECIHTEHDTCAICTTCGVSVEHRYENKVTAPTCTTPGFTTYTCGCGYTYIGNETEATGHTYTDGLCTVCAYHCPHDWADGICVKCAVICSHSEHDSQGICNTCGFTVDHKYATEVNAPTCTTSGFTIYTCVCGHSYKADETEAVGHTYTDGVCTVCAYHCPHDWADGICVECAVICSHSEHDSQGICNTCGFTVEHEYVAEVTAPTCTTPGFTSYICSCGNSYIANETEILEHKFLNGLCTYCGAEEPVIMPSVNLLYPALSFEDEVKIHVFFNAEHLDHAEEVGLIIYHQEVTSWSVETADAVVSGYRESQDAGVYYCSTMGIHAKALGDRVYFSVYIRTVGGEYVYSPLRNYSPVDYAYNHLSKPTTSPEVKALVVAMLNYGAAAQHYFGYNTDNPVNATLIDAQRAMVVDYNPNMIAPLQESVASKNGDFTAVVGSFDKKRPAVSFKGAFSIEYFFTPAHTPEGDILLYYWDQDAYDSVDVCKIENATGVLTMQLREDGQYHTSVEGISAKNLDQTVFASAVYTSGNIGYCSGVLNYHIGVYCRSFASYENDAQELAASTAVYGYYAKAYFRKAV